MGSSLLLHSGATQPSASVPSQNSKPISLVKSLSGGLGPKTRRPPGGLCRALRILVFLLFCCWDTARAYTGEYPIPLSRALSPPSADQAGNESEKATGKWSDSFGGKQCDPLHNLILYGKANPVDAIELLGPYVQGIHAKDGLWPVNPRKLGEEVPIGKGKVDFPRIIARLKEMNYRGAVTIEREISGPQQVEDVRAAKAYLEKLIG